MPRMNPPRTLSVVRTAVLLVAALIVSSAAGLSAATSPAVAATGEATLFGSEVPAVASFADTSAVELGVWITPKTNGTISGIRFYKGAANRGTHTGSLWSASGAKLATATFTRESATGWQEVRFAAPVAVTAGRRYVASYYAPQGGYAAAADVFAAPLTRGDLTAPVSAGTYRYGSSGFPRSTYNASNYYVDVLFAPAATTTPTTPTPTPTTTSTPTPTPTPTATTPSPTPTPTPTPTASAPTTPPASFAPGNRDGAVAVPAGLGLEDTSRPDRVVGTGTAASCTSDAVVAAVAAGGVVTFNCGAAPVTITLNQTLKVRNSIQKLVIDGGGRVTLSGGGVRRILYIDTCDTSLGSVSGNCLYAPAFPNVTVQNLTMTGGNATNETYVSPGDDGQGVNGGGAIFALGGRLKVVDSIFTGNTCAPNGPDLGGGAIRVLAQNSPTPNDLDVSYAANNQNPVAIVGSTFGGAAGQGNSCSNGGAVSGLRTPITIVNSLLTNNSAVGCCSNPAKPGTPGGGSGGAVYTDGGTYDVRIAGSRIQSNTAKAGGSALFYVSNPLTGRLYIDRSTLSGNTYVASGQSTPQSFENYPGIFYLGNGEPVFTSSTIR